MILSCWVKKEKKKKKEIPANQKLKKEEEKLAIHIFMFVMRIKDHKKK